MLLSLHDVTVGEPDRDLVLTAVDLDLGAVRTADVERPLGHGSRAGADFLEAGSLTMTLRTRYGIRDAAAANQAAAAFLRAWRTDLRAAPGTLTPLLIETGGRARVVYGRAGRISPPAPDSALVRQGLIEIIAEFRILDPLVYEPIASGVTISVIPRSLGGIIAPITTPVTTTMTSGTAYRVLHVAGDAPAPLRVTFHGPATDPSITVGGVTVGITGAIAYDEDITIDGRTRTVTLADGTTVATRLSRASRIDRLAVEPGDHEIAFSATDPTGTARVTVEASPAYYHL